LPAAIIALLLVAARPIGATEPPGSEASRAAIELCHRAQTERDDERAELLEQSLARADAAIASDDRDALAHFARFCALGEQAKTSGLRLTGLLKLRSIRAAVERTLELSPDFPDALLGLGSLLIAVPGFLGGDDAEGERLVRRALAIDPEYVGARLTLAEQLAERGDREAAREEAERALASAERKGDVAQGDDARRLLAELSR
jgi:tetratricopeptide (TPR) repeat protein